MRGPSEGEQITGAPRRTLRSVGAAISKRGEGWTATGRPRREWELAEVEMGRFGGEPIDCAAPIAWCWSGAWVVSMSADGLLHYAMCLKVLAER